MPDYGDDRPLAQIAGDRVAAMAGYRLITATDSLEKTQHEIARSSIQMPA